jgi:ribosome-binding factor A
MNRRADRVGDAIQHAIAEMLLREIKDPRIGMVTLTAVRVSDDLRHARVFFSVIGDDAQRARSLAGLESARGYIRSHLARQLKLRVAPEIRFEFDPGLERAEAVARLLRKEEEEPGE